MPEMYEAVLEGEPVVPQNSPLDLSRETACYGAQTGMTSEMCGGCDHCLAMQSYHYGYKLVDLGLWRFEVTTDEL